jgi:hypothetical protein
MKDKSMCKVCSVLSAGILSLLLILMAGCKPMADANAPGHGAGNAVAVLPNTVWHNADGSLEIHFTGYDEVNLVKGDEDLTGKWLLGDSSDVIVITWNDNAADESPIVFNSTEEAIMTLNGETFYIMRQ